MVIHDCSTTISCSICSDEFTIEKYLSEKAMRKVAAKSGWHVINGEDVCPKHDAQINAAPNRQKPLLYSGTDEIVDAVE